MNISIKVGENHYLIHRIWFDVSTSYIHIEFMNSEQKLIELSGRNIFLHIASYFGFPLDLYGF